MLRRSPLRRLLLLNRAMWHLALPLPSQPHLRSPPAQRAAPHLLQPPLGIEQLFPRYPSHGSLVQLLQLLSLRSPRRVSSLLGRGSCALTALQIPLMLCQFHINESRPLLLKRLTPIILACPCLLLTLRPLWTLRPILGMTSVLACTHMTSVFAFHRISADF